MPITFNEPEAGDEPWPAWIANSVIALILLAISLFALRIIRIIPMFRRGPLKRKRGSPTRLLVVLGSGGHTTEMMSMLGKMGRPGMAAYTHRTYVVGQGDAFSARCARTFEKEVMGVDAEALKKAEMPADKLEKNGSNDGEEEGESNGSLQESWLDVAAEALKQGGVPEFQTTPESSKASKVTSNGQSTVSSTYDIVFVPRARKVYQSLLTTPFSATSCLIASLIVLLAPTTTEDAEEAARFLAFQRDIFQKKLSSAQEEEAKGEGSTRTRMQTQLAMMELKNLETVPEPSESTLRAVQKEELGYSFPTVVLTNGPATGGVLIAGSLLLRALDWRGCESRLRSLRTVYVESWARVTSLSLTGRLVRPVVDRYLVQWEALKAKGSEFRGVLV